MTLSEDSVFLNFVYLTATFHKFVINSNKSYEEALQNPINKKKKNYKTSSNERIGEESNLTQEFTKLNTNNYLDYLEHLDLISEENDDMDEKDIKKIKLN